MHAQLDVIQSQDLGILLKQFRAQCEQPEQLAAEAAAQVLASRYCIVPSHGIGEWLKSQLALQQGIIANLKCVAPRTFQWEMFSRVLGHSTIAKAPHLLNMKWGIVAFLQRHLQQATPLQPTDPLYPLLSRVVEQVALLEDATERRRREQHMLFWIADHVSRLFANYVIYRGQCLGRCQPAPSGACRCRQNWLSYWADNQPLPVAKWLRREDTDLSAITPAQLAQANHALGDHLASDHSQTNTNQPDTTYADASQAAQAVQQYQLNKAVEWESWQRFLWYQIFAKDFNDIQKIEQDFWHQLASNDQQARSRLPAMVPVFTVQQLPPSHFQFLQRLAQYTHVKIFHYTASREYWADTVDPQWQARLQLRHPERENYYSSGHPLLTRLGKQARDNGALLAEMSGGEQGEWLDLFAEEEDTQQRTLLQQIQYDMLHLLDQRELAQSVSLSPQDQSLQFHVCYSMQRQLEVLREQLIDWLSQPQQPRRQPRDVLVLVPDLLAAEPLIRTVFAQSGQLTDKGRQDRQAGQHQPSIAPEIHLPIRLSGVAQQDGLQLWRALTRQLTLLQGRCGLDDWLDYLGLLPIQQRYGLNFDDVQRMATLLEAAGFRRGFDEQHLAGWLETGDTDYRYTLQYALKRLTLALAMPESLIFQEVLSLTGVYAEDFRLIGVLLHMYADLDQRRERLDQIKPVKDEIQHLEDDLSVFAAMNVPGHQQVRDEIHQFDRAIKQARQQQFDVPLQSMLDDIAGTLSSKLEKTTATGQITFAQIGQLRTLPYGLVVCLGMDSGAIPRRDQQLAFDLMAALRGELGDRSRLDDDHGAFLDALLQARQALWVFYNGFDVNDHELRDPSSLVQELIQHLELLIMAPLETQPQAAHEQTARLLGISQKLAPLFRIHPVYPFEAAGFAEQTVRFQDQWYAVAKQLQDQLPAQHWLAGLQSGSDPAGPAVVLQSNIPELIDSRQWIRDLSVPPLAFLRQLGISTVQQRQQSAAFEPIVADRLDQYVLREAVQVDQAIDEQQQLLQDCLPIGKTRDATLQVALTERQQLEQRVSLLGGQTPTTLHDRIIHGQPWRIVAPTAPGCQRWVSMTVSRNKPERLLAVWLQYLLWVIADAGQQSGLQRIMVFRDVTVAFAGLDVATAQQLWSHWHELWQASMGQPLALPPALLLGDKGSLLKEQNWQPEPDGRWTYKKWQNLAETWQGRHYYSHGSGQDATTDLASSLHPLWALLIERNVAARAFAQAFDRYAAYVYRPIGQFWFTCEPEQEATFFQALQPNVMGTEDMDAPNSAGVLHV